MKKGMKQRSTVPPKLSAKALHSKSLNAAHGQKPARECLHRTVCAERFQLLRSSLLRAFPATLFSHSLYLIHGKPEKAYFGFTMSLQSRSPRSSA